MSDLSGLSPPGLARASALAAVQNIAIRILSLPDELKANAKPLTLDGTVAGRNPDGATNIATERGIVTILLKDRGVLASGQPIQLDIPAGKPPFGGTIRASTAQTAPHSSQNPLAQLPPLFRLDREAILRLDDIAEAISQIPPGAAVKPAPIVPGQIISLTALPQNLPGDTAPPQTIDEILHVIRQAVASGLEAETDLISVLSRIDRNLIASLLERGSSTDVPLPVKALLQAIEAKAPTVATPLPSTLDGDMTVLTLRDGTDGVLKIAPPAQPARPGVTASPVPVLFAQVTGFTPAGQPIIRLPAQSGIAGGSYMMNIVPEDMSLGSVLFLAPDARHGMPSGPAALSIPGTPLAEWTSGPWTSLQEIIDGTAQLLGPHAAAPLQLVRAAGEPKHFGAIAALFIALTRSGSADLALGGKGAAILRLTKSDLVRQLSGELASASRLEQTALPGEWRGLVLPFVHDQQIHKLPVYYRHGQDDDAEAETQERRRRTTRFLFELRLSRMGNVQLDGFMRQKNLDMILRTRAPVGLSMQSAVRRLYASAMERSNLTGEIGFQSRPEQWVSISSSP